MAEGALFAGLAKDESELDADPPPTARLGATSGAVLCGCPAFEAILDGLPPMATVAGAGAGLLVCPVLEFLEGSGFLVSGFSAMAAGLPGVEDAPVLETAALSGVDVTEG